MITVLNEVKALEHAKALLEEAKRKYTKGGWDRLYECFEPEDLVREWREYGYLTKAAQRKDIMFRISVWAEREADARISSGEGGGW